MNDGRKRTAAQNGRTVTSHISSGTGNVDAYDVCRAVEHCKWSRDIDMSASVSVFHVVKGQVNSTLQIVATPASFPSAFCEDAATIMMKHGSEPDIWNLSFGSWILRRVRGRR